MLTSQKLVKQQMMTMTTASSDWEALHNPIWRPALIAGIGLVFLQQVSLLAHLYILYPMSLSSDLFFFCFLLIGSTDRSQANPPFSITPTPSLKMWVCQTFLPVRTYIHTSRPTYIHAPPPIIPSISPSPRIPSPNQQNTQC